MSENQNEQPEPAKATYLPGLNGVRALAASIVLLWHVDQFAHLFGLESYGYGATGMSGSAVTFFFVLSGFLITLLLLKEQARFGSIDVMKFYGRRVLRIWPLYYLATLLTLFFFQHLPTDKLPDKDLGTAFLLYIFFMPNVAYAFDFGIRSILPLWSVGVEEQFYLVWPWLFKSSKRLPRILWGIIIGFLIVKTGARFLENGPFYNLLRMTTIDCMAAGGLCAWAVFTESKWLKVIHSVWVQVFCWTFLLIGIVYKPLQITSLLDAETHAVVYACIIVNVSTNRNTLITLENPVANFLGRISYGIYVYHMPVICCLAYYLGPTILSIQPAWARLGVALALTFGITVLVAKISHRYFESWFLAKKNRLALVPSTDKGKSHDTQSK